MIMLYYYYYIIAAATTAIAGILHLLLVPNVISFNVNNAIFFLVSGIVQIFWALPMIKKWGKIWYYIGIAGTIILIMMWAMTRMPRNPITGRGGLINEIGIAIEVFQIAYVVITAIIIVKESKKGARISTKEKIR
jgi:hypothetical protein